MSISRYAFSKRYGGHKTKVASSKANYIIFKAVNSGAVKYTTKILQEGERLDQIAGEIYEDGSLWWVIAAASGIGWGLQVPPGTLLRIPVDISTLFGLLV
jgi:nucleoid-associated protein YgaU